MKISKKECQNRYGVLIKRLQECQGMLKDRARLATDSEGEFLDQGDACQLLCDELEVVAVAKGIACGPGA